MPLLTLALTGCLWISETEHLVRVGGAEPSTTTLPEAVDPILALLDDIDACAPELQLKGSVSADYANQILPGSVSVGTAPPIPVQLEMSPEAGPRAPFTASVDLSVLDLDAVCAPASCDVVLRVNEESVSGKADLLPDSPEITASVGGSSITSPVDDPGNVEVSVAIVDPRVDAIGVTLHLCPTGSASIGATCAVVTSTTSLTDDTLTLSTTVGDVNNAICQDVDAEAHDLWLRFSDHACVDDLLIPSATAVSWRRDCDQDGLFNTDDCDDNDNMKGNTELCGDGIDNDCDGETQVITVGTTPYATIQAAVDAAASGDTVTLCEGVFDEVVTIDKSLNIDGSGLSWWSPNDTPITVTGKMGSPLSVDITNLTLTGSTSGFGGAIHAEHTDLTLLNVTIQDSVANQGGGALYLLAGSLVATDCTFTANYAEAGGALYLHAVDAVLADSTVSGNEADLEGGAAFVEISRLEGGTYASNIAPAGETFVLTGVPANGLDLFPELDQIVDIEGSYERGAILTRNDVILRNVDLIKDSNIMPPDFQGIVVSNGRAEVSDSTPAAVRVEGTAVLAACDNATGASFSTNDSVPPYPPPDMEPCFTLDGVSGYDLTDFTCACNLTNPPVFPL